MDVVFYDRKNRREVKASQLMRTKVVCEVLQGDSQDPPESFKDLETETIEGIELPGRLAFHTFELGDICYKTTECPQFRNWDMYLRESDLVFLRLED